MLKKRVWIVSPVFYVLIAAMLLMAGASWFWDERVFFAELGLAAACAVAVLISLLKFRSYVRTVAKSAGGMLSGIDKNAMEHFPVAVAVAGEAGELVWNNLAFAARVCGERDHTGESVLQFTEGKSIQQILSHNGTDVSYGSRRFTVFGAESGSSTILYFIDDTYYKETTQEYSESRPAVALILFDNREELARDATDEQEAQITAQVDNALQKWVAKTSGFLRKISGGRYLMIVQERNIRSFVENKFEILDEIRSIKLDERRSATISIGVGRGGGSLKECEAWARKALDMALGRGGDQAAVKQGETYAFFGGVSKGVEKRDKVRTRVIASALSDQIRISDCVLIMGHRYSDLDSVGASVGMWGAVTRGLGKPAYVVVNREQTLARVLVDNVEQAEGENVFISTEQAESVLTDNTLLIIVDTHSPDFVESRSLYEKAKRVVVIDHHRMMVSHISDAIIFYHEPYASSASEMVGELVQYLGEEGIGRVEAEALLAGIMLDTKNFVLKTGVRTFEAAAFLRRKGADTVEVKRLFSNSIDTYKAKYQLVSCAEIFHQCAIAIAEDNFPDIRIASAQAADELLGVQGVRASFVLYPTEGEINISARSLGEVNVQVIMEELGGGGHQTMAAAQLKGVTVPEARDRLIAVLSEAKI